MSLPDPTEWRGRRSIHIDALRHAILDHITFTLARDPTTAPERDVFMATAWSVRDLLAERWAATLAEHRRQDAKRVYYLSMEVLLGRSLVNALVNLQLTGAAAEALAQLGYALEELAEREPDAGLGNGGLGRLAACYLDAMATLGLPGYGYSIRYEHGIFAQEIRGGHQIEQPDNWLRDLNPWEIARPDCTYTVKFYGRVETASEPDGRARFRWVDTRDVLATAYDMPIPGYRGRHVNTLRLWAARATEEFDLEEFNRGDYLAAVLDKVESETISKVLYPPDDTGQGKELRLKQQYFFVSATLQDILRTYKQERRTFADFPDKVQIQLNDTHPALAIPELMRLLLDEEGLPWDEAWRLTRRTFAYTNHTVLPEALEVWDLDLFGRLLPRHLQIVEEIDRRLRARAQDAFGGDAARVERVAVLANRQVRMAHLAIVGSHTVNGVAQLHTRILRERHFADFAALWPEKFVAITNGITPRRWLLQANPALADLITERIGPGWVTDLDQLRLLETAIDDAAFRAQWQAVRRGNKERLAARIAQLTGQRVDPAWLFDAQVKRIHEYKRQHLNALRLAHLVLTLRDDPDAVPVPRVVIFAGKAAPTYRMAKLIIRFLHALLFRIEEEPRLRERLRVVFLPNYGVSLAELIVPGTDLAEHISTAGYEASGTGNMKFALNGARTLGTWDGATVELADAIGPEHLFLFGLTAEEVAARKAAGYDPAAVIAADPRIARVLAAMEQDVFTPEEPGVLRPLVENLRTSDPYLVLADFAAYLEAQEAVDRAWLDPEGWTRASLLSTARCGFVSADRAVREYARSVWKVPV